MFENIYIYSPVCIPAWVSVKQNISQLRLRELFHYTIRTNQTGEWYFYIFIMKNSCSIGFKSQRLLL